jgi:hypothetical protein
MALVYGANVTTSYCLAPDAARPPSRRPVYVSDPIGDVVEDEGGK